MSCLWTCDAVTFLWRVAFGYWPIICCRWVLWIHLSVGIYYHTLIQLRGYLRSFIRADVQADLNTLTWIKVIRSTKPIWNIYIVWYFLSFIYLNNQRSNYALVSHKIQTSDLRDCRRAGYLLNYIASLQKKLSKHKNKIENVKRTHSLFEELL
jgi:hypothetical protein